MKRCFVFLALACSFSAFAMASVTVRVSSPTGTTAASPVNVSASASSSQATISGWRIYVDGVSVHAAGAVSQISSPVTMSSGTHKVVVRAWDRRGNYGSSYLTLTVPNSVSQTISVKLSPTSASVQTRATQQFTATVSGTTKTGTTFFVNGLAGGNSTYGTITSAGLYSAPATGRTVSIMATSSADTTKSASATVTIAAAGSAVTVSVNPTSATVVGATTQQFHATVGGTTNTAVNWSVNQVAAGNSTYGTITNNGLYTAPACPSSSTANIQAQSAYDSSVKATATVTLSASANNNIHYVARGGNDSNAGTACSPWATIQKAANSVNAGDTVLVGDGIYNETVAITRGGTASAPVIFKSQNKWGAKIEPTSTSGNANYSVTIAGVSYVTLQDFEITATSTTDSAVKFFLGAPNNSVIGNNIHDVGVSTTTCTSGSGVLVADNYETVAGNYIWNVGPPRTANFRCNQQHGIYVTSGNAGHLQNNVLFDIWQGLAFHLTGQGLSNWTITNNTLFNVGDNVHSDGGGFILDCLGGTCDYNTVNNNIFYGMQNTTFYETNDGGTIGSHNVYSNNLVYNSAANTLVTGHPVNTVATDPMFNNNTGDQNGDYHVQSSSPAIGTGTASGAPSTDFDGNTRSTSSEVIGSYVK